jgi:hypothetical protein
MKTITLEGRRYRLTSHYGRTYLEGPGLIARLCILAEGVTQDDPDIRRHAADALAAYRERHKRAQESVARNMGWTKQQ